MYQKIRHLMCNQIGPVLEIPSSAGDRFLTFTCWFSGKFSNNFRPTCRRMCTVKFCEQLNMLLQITRLQLAQQLLHMKIFVCSLNTLYKFTVAASSRNGYLWISSVDRHRYLRSRRGQLDVPRVRLSTYRGRAFCHAGPSAWNTLPVCLKNNTLSLSNFRHKLKHFYFSSY